MVWTGDPPFDAHKIAELAAILYKRYQRFFHSDLSSPYTIFMRNNAVNPGGGFGQRRAFVLTYGASFPGNDANFLKVTLAHEMFHTFQPMIAREGDMLHAWNTEGFAVYYGRELPLRYKMISSADFLDNLNSTAARYYTDKFIHASNQQAAAHFWTDTRYRMLAYDRGSFYLTKVDEALRRQSHGRQTLDDLLMKLSRKAGEAPLVPDDWEKLIFEELGQEGVDDYHAFLDGALQIPESGAYGPCFRRTSKMLRQFDLGFDPEALTEPGRVVHGLEHGSEAEKAGLRDGDAIIDPIGQDVLQFKQTSLVNLNVRRGGQRFTITYLPRGEAVPAYQWERVAGIPEDRCG